MRPSIIFFDEIDGLAPVRSTRQEQIHSSIVSTLLALMDGLDSRGDKYNHCLLIQKVKDVCLELNLETTD